MDTLTAPEWRAVVGYEGVYEVSSAGQVRRIAGGNGAVAGRILKPANPGRPTPKVTLVVDGVKVNALIAGLVAAAFPPVELEQAPEVVELAELAERIRARAEDDRRDRSRQRELIRQRIDAGATWDLVQREARVSRPTITVALNRLD